MQRRSFLGSLIVSALGLLGLRAAERKPKSLLEAMRSNAPGGWTDDRYDLVLIDKPVALFLMGPLDGLFRVMPSWFTPDTYTERVPVNDMMVSSVIYDRIDRQLPPMRMNGQLVEVFIYRPADLPAFVSGKAYQDEARNPYWPKQQWHARGFIDVGNSYEV